jgi:hypothetical protein
LEDFLPRLRVGLVCVVELFRRQTRNLNDRPDFDGPLASARNPGGNADRFVKILRLDQEITAKLFPRLGARAVIGPEPDAAIALIPEGPYVLAKASAPEMALR